MTELMNDANTQLATMSEPVQIWMNWMMFVFLLSVVFLKTHKGARYALAALFLSIPVGFAVFYFSRNVHLLGIVHLIVWAPLLLYLVKKEIKSEQFNVKSAYGIWVSLLSLTIAVSLVFDIRDIFLVLTGHK